MPIFLLQPFPGSRKKKKRVGRGEGSGHGKTSGRGQKGQKARTGYSKKIGFEGGQMPLYKRIPKRGFHNPFKIEYQVVNLEKIDKIQTQGEITIETLYENGLIRKKNQPVKILGMGEISKPLTIKANAASKSAIQKVESKGGKIEIIQF
ncbi:MAG: 50S ribosomal protein L15 [Leptospiraceae bacterium]|nr:50S ribosomal protein L15 [Leptospiraceae bacterium]MDW7975190.1 50S ribosomal protein L15 [Leptospiraceae bacterium]